MKITKQQLNQIIKEEIQAVVAEEIATEPEPLLQSVIAELTRHAERGMPIGGVISQLHMVLQMIQTRPLNEISPKTEFNPGGFKGILNMAEQAEYAIDNLETKFGSEPPEEIYTLQKFVESIKKAAMWQIAGAEAPSAMHGMAHDTRIVKDFPGTYIGGSDPNSQRLKQVRRMHTPAYKRDI